MLRSTKILAGSTALVGLAFVVPAAFALPAGGTAVDGNITFDANNLNQTSARGIAEYSSFNIGAGETYNVNNGSGATLIRDLQNARTEIAGTLNATGNVMLVNGNGVFFNNSAVVNVNSLIATTSDISNANFMAGNYEFDQSGTSAATVENHGTIIAQNGGTVGLVGNGGAINTGVIIADAGNIHLAAADRFVVDFDGDGLINFAVSSDMEAAMAGNDAEVTNSGTLRAQKGTIGMTASAANSVLNGVINTSGIVQASEATKRNGKIVLSGGGTAQLAGTMSAREAHVDVDVTTNTANTNGEIADAVYLKSPNAKIDDGIKMVTEGGVVDLRNGTYTQNGTLNINKSLTLRGQSRGNTVIDSSGVSGYSLHVTAPNVSLNRFTLQGGGHYGVKADRGANTGVALTGFSMNNVAVQGSGRTEIDLNGLDGATLTNVRALGQNTSGNGFSITGSTNVVLDGVRTDGLNQWGGIAIYPDSAYGSLPTSVQVLNAGNVKESNALYVESQGLTTTSLYAPEFFFAVRNDTFRPGAANFTFFQRTESDATAFATGAGFAGHVPNSTIQTVRHLAGSPESLVDDLHFVVGNDAMSIQKALSRVATGGLVEVRDGTYAFGSTMNINRSVTLEGESQAGTVLNYGGTGYGMHVTANYVTLQNFSLNGNATNTGGHRGIKVDRGSNMATPLDNFTLKNATVSNFGRTEVDLNGVRNALVQNVTANGNGTAGNGFSITSGQNVVLDNLMTDGNNAWGGLAIYAGGSYGEDTTGVQVINTSGILEQNALFVENDAGFTSTDLYLPEYDYVVRNNTYRANGDHFVHYQRSEADAINFATSAFFTGAVADSTVQETTHNDSAQETLLNGKRFVVGNGMNIQKAINEVDANGRVSVKNGTYTQNGTLNVNKSLTLIGENINNTIIDSSGVSGYSIHVTAPDVDMRRFTLNGGGHYGIKVDRGANTGTALSNFRLQNVVVRGSGRTEIDINGVDGALIKNVRALGQNTSGNGFSITGSTDVVLDGVRTDGLNQWGGIAIYPDGAYGSLPTSVQVLNAGNVKESNALYVESQGLTTTSLYAPEFFFAVRNDAHRPGGENFTFFQRTENDATAFATGFGGFNTASTIQTVTHDAATPESTVDAANFIVGNGMSIATALSDITAGGLISVRDGTFSENLAINKGVTISGNGAGNTILAEGGTTQDGVVNVNAAGQNVNLQNLTVAGASSAGVNPAYGVKVDAGNVEMSNVQVDGQNNGGTGVYLYAPDGTLVTANTTSIINYDLGLLVEGNAAVPQGNTAALLGAGTVLSGNGLDIRMNADGYVTDARLASFNDAAVVTDIPGRVEALAGNILLPDGAVVNQNGVNGDNAVTQSQRTNVFFQTLEALLLDLGGTFDIASMIEPAAGGDVPSEAEQTAELNRRLAIILQYYLETGNLEDTEDALRGLLMESLAADSASETPVS